MGCNFAFIYSHKRQVLNKKMEVRPKVNILGVDGAFNSFGDSRKEVNWLNIR